MELCKQCGTSLNEDGTHPKGYHKMNEEVLSFRIRLECKGCGAKVNLKTIREDGVNNWHFIDWFEACFCPGCSHQLGLDK